MRAKTEDAIAILADLVAFESLPGEPNLDIVGYVAALLERHGVRSHLSFDAEGRRANLHAVIGPETDGGILLNGHTDVVPVAGQSWTSPPFTLRSGDGRLYGRGSVDMKGFIACTLAAAGVWSQMQLARPLHIALSYDEEIGGLGAPILVEDMRSRPMPAIAIVGEPTGMRMISGHKGGYEMRTQFTGSACHACDPRKGVNAIAYAGRFVARLDEIARRLAANARPGSAFEPAYSTINVGTIHGGAGRNVVAGDCAIDWELRPLPGDDGRAILAEIEQFAQVELVAEMRLALPTACIETVCVADVPALDETQSGEAVALISHLTGLNEADVVSFGTDAGHFCAAGISTVVFGPGSIDQAHRPDEFIEESQMAACLDFLSRLGEHCRAS